MGSTFQLFVKYFVVCLGALQLVQVPGLVL